MTMASIPTLPEAITRDDIGQQMVIELLAAALEGPTVPARWTPNRLLSLATRGTYRRWLAREVSSLARTAPFDRDEAARFSEGDLVRLVAELAARERATAGFEILYRKEVLGEQIAEIAADTGHRRTPSGFGAAEPSIGFDASLPPDVEACISAADAFRSPSRRLASHDPAGRATIARLPVTARPH